MAYCSVNTPSATNKDLDAIRHLTLDLTEIEYSEDKEYTEGDYCYRYGKLYRYENNNWIETDILNELKLLRASSSGVGNTQVVSIPSTVDALTYNGETQVPKWYAHNFDNVQATGELEGTNARTYTATFTPEAGYSWADGSTGDKDVEWTINEANAELVLSTHEVSLNEYPFAKTVSITKTGDGVVTAVSSDTSIATVEVAEDESSLTIRAMGNGECTVTVSFTTIENYITLAGQLIEVIANPYAVANLEPMDSVTYVDGISTLNQMQLKKYARAISDNANISNETSIVYVDDGSAHYKVSVGDMIDIAFDDEMHSAKIMGFNHYTLDDPEYYGERTVTCKAGFVFQTHDCLSTSYQMNTSNTNSGGWKDSNLRRVFRTTVKNSLPIEWQNIIAPISRYLSCGGMTSSLATVTNETLFVPSAAEIFGTNYAFEIFEGTRYAYYAAGNHARKTFEWWLCTAYAKNNGSFLYVHPNGTPNNLGYASNSRYVAPCWCV